MRASTCYWKSRTTEVSLFHWIQALKSYWIYNANFVYTEIKYLNFFASLILQIFYNLFWIWKAKFRCPERNMRTKIQRIYFWWCYLNSEWEHSQFITWAQVDFVNNSNPDSFTKEPTGAQHWPIYYLAAICQTIKYSPVTLWYLNFSDFAWNQDGTQTTYWCDNRSDFQFQP